MLRASQRHYSLEDYLSLEESSATRHEYCAGEIFAMAGSSVNHNQIALNIYSAFRAAVTNQSCEAFLGDVRLRTQTGLYTYPDVMVICGAVELTSERLDTVTNPVAIFEVLSTATQDYDQGEKFEHYRSIPGLKDFVLISQYERRVIHWFRDDAGHWEQRELQSHSDALQLTSVRIEMLLSNLYQRVVL